MEHFSTFMSIWVYCSNTRLLIRHTTIYIFFFNISLTSLQGIPNFEVRIFKKCKSQKKKTGLKSPGRGLSNAQRKEILWSKCSKIEEEKTGLSATNKGKTFIILSGRTFGGLTLVAILPFPGILVYPEAARGVSLRTICSGTWLYTSSILPTDNIFCGDVIMWLASSICWFTPITSVRGLQVKKSIGLYQVYLYLALYQLNSSYR